MQTRAEKSSSGIAAAWPRAWRCLLMICVWQGPIPWWHCHDTTASGETPSPWLVRHLHDFHPSLPACSTCALGWHMHLSFPEPSDDSEESSQNSDSQFLPATSAAGDTLALHRIAGVRSWDAAHDLLRVVVTVSRRMIGPTTIARHFFDGFADALPLPLRFGVARC